MSGGGGGSSQTPFVSADSLKSVANVYVLHALCEGPIQGFSMPDSPLTCPIRDHADKKLKCSEAAKCVALGYCIKPEKCIKLNGTPIQNTDGTYNFGNVSTAYRLGYPHQEYIPDFFIASADISGSVGLPVQVRKEPLITGGIVQNNSGARTVTINDLDADEISLRFAVYGLYKQDDKGNVHGSEITLKIEIREYTPAAQSNDNYGWVDVSRFLPYQKTGKASSKYEWSGTVSLNHTSTNGEKPVGPWQVRVSRITDDSNTQQHVNDTWWEGLAIIKNKKLRYPSVALCAVRADATQFNSIPTMSFSVKGMIIRVPYNYNPVSRQYSGVWDGRFKLAWSNNPAWCFYDLLIEKRYGLGDWIKPEYVDKWGLYEIGKYCDEMVSTGRQDADGADIKEPRYTLNCYIQTQEEAVRVVQLLASAFHAMTYWAAGAVFAAQDRPTDPSYLFTPANVKDGQFVYSATARRARHNVVVTQWNNPENNYKMEPELYELDEEIRDLGFRFPVDRVAFGCTSRSQAIRDAKHTLFTENHQTEMVSFGVGLEGAQLRPGDVIAVSDPLRIGTSMGGRVKGVTGNIVTLDREVELEDAQYNLIVTDAGGKVVESTVLSLPGNTDRLELITPVDTTENAVWILAAKDKAPDLWRVISVTNDDEGGYAVLALSYDPQKYDWVEKNIVLQDRRGWVGDTFPRALRPPQGVVLSEYLYKDKDDLKVGVSAQWTAGHDELRYLPSYQVDNNNWVEMPATSQNVVDIEPVEAPCRLIFVVRAQNAKGETTPPAQVSFDVYGKTKPPHDVEQFNVTCGEDNILVFSWNPNEELDFSHYEIREGANWENGYLLVTDLTANSFTIDIGKTRRTTFWIKARDTSGNWSYNAASTIYQIYNPKDVDVLSVPEKQALAIWWAETLQEQERLSELASRYGVSMDAYNSAVAAIPDFFVTRETPYLWTDFSGVTCLGTGGGALLTTLRKAVAEQYVILSANIAVGNMAADIANGATNAMLKSGFVDDITGLIKWDKIAVAFKKVFAHEMYMANFDNLIPNPMSEIIPDEGVWPPEAIEGRGVVTENAFAGSRCRYVGAGETLFVTDDIPCGYEDQFCFQAQIWGAGARIEIYFGNAHEAFATSSNSTSYNQQDCHAKAPRGTTRVRFALYGGTGGAYFDDLYARRMADALLLVDGAVKAQHLEAALAIAGEIRSPNFSAGGTLTAPTGFKISGAPFPVRLFGDTKDTNVQAVFGSNVSIGGVLVASIKEMYTGGVNLIEPPMNATTPLTTIIDIPAAVRRIRVQLMGAGAGGVNIGTANYNDGVPRQYGDGGGSGGAIDFEFELPHSTQDHKLTIVVGNGGTGAVGAFGAGTNGGDTYAMLSTVEIGRAFGGQGMNGGGARCRSSLTSAVTSVNGQAASNVASNAPGYRAIEYFEGSSLNSNINTFRKGAPGCKGSDSIHGTMNEIKGAGGKADAMTTRGSGGMGGSPAYRRWATGGDFPIEMLPPASATAGEPGQPGFARISW